MTDTKPWWLEHRNTPGAAPLTDAEIQTFHGMEMARNTIQAAVGAIPFVHRVMQACQQTGVPERDFHTVLAANLINQWCAVEEARKQVLAASIKPMVIVTDAKHAESIVALLQKP